MNATPRPLYSREGGPVPFVEDAGWAPEPVLTGMEGKKSLACTISEPLTLLPVAIRYTDYAVSASI